MRKGLLAFGVLCLVALVVVWGHGGGTAESSPEPVTWLVHHDGRGSGPLREAQVDLLEHAPAHVEILTVVGTKQDERAMQKLTARRKRSRVVRVTAPVSPWARDRYLIYERDGKPHLMARPVADLPRPIRGDGEIPDMLKRAHPDLVIVRTPLAPEGGDVIFTDRGVITSRRGLEIRAKRTGKPLHAVVRELEGLFGRTVLVVGRRDQAHLPLHVDVYIANAGDGRLLVADPVKAQQHLQGASLSALGDFSPAVNAAAGKAFGAVAARLESFGFEVHRVPSLFSGKLLPGQQTPTVLTYANAIREGRQVFVPSYGHAALDRAGRAAWERLGFTAVAIRCREPARNGGAVRCLTNRYPPERLR